MTTTIKTKKQATRWLFKNHTPKVIVIPAKWGEITRLEFDVDGVKISSTINTHFAKGFSLGGGSSLSADPTGDGLYFHSYGTQYEVSNEFKLSDDGFTEVLKAIGYDAVKGSDLIIGHAYFSISDDQLKCWEFDGENLIAPFSKCGVNKKQTYFLTK
jgi:hypothetical protein